MGNPETSQVAPSTVSKGGVDMDFEVRPRKQPAEAVVTTEKVPCATCGAECEQRVRTYPGGIVSRWPETPICDACGDAASRKAKDERLAKELQNASKCQDSVWLAQSGIEKMGSFCLKKLDEFERDRQPRAYDTIVAWDGESLILASPGCYGVGKSHLVCALAVKLLLGATAKIVGGCVRKFPCPVFVTNEARLIGRVRQTFNRHNDDEEDAETEEGIYRSLLQPDLLIIDDVGKVRPRDLSFLQGVYYRIIDDRYIEEKSVILTTNLSLEELEQHIGGACSDRLREMCGKDRIIVMAGQSYRRQK